MSEIPFGETRYRKPPTATSDAGGPRRPPARLLRPWPTRAPAETATLLVCCPDRRGIVAALAQLLYGHGANILDADQHTDPEAGQFFQRIRFDLRELHTDRRSLSGAIARSRASASR